MSRNTPKKVSRLNFLKFTHLRLLNFILLFALIGSLFLHFTLAATAGWYYTSEATHIQLINNRRTSMGKNALAWSGCVTNASREHARVLSTSSTLYHSNLADLLRRHCGDYGYMAGENVGRFHSDATSAFNGYVNSPGHRANIDGAYSHVGVGVWKNADGGEASVQIFVQMGDGAFGNFNQAVNAYPVPSYSSGVVTNSTPVFGTLGKTAGYAETFARGTDDALYHKYYKNGWSGWEPLGGQLTSSPAWVSWGQNRVDVFARGTDGALWHKWGNNTGWSGWTSLGGVLSSAPAVTSWSSGVLHVFARGTDGAIWYRSCGSESQCNGTNWDQWKTLGGKSIASPSAASMGVNLLNVLATGTDQRVYNNYWNGSAWSGWQVLPVGHKVQDKTGPAAVSMGANLLNVFAQGTDNALYNIWWDGVRWNGPQNLGGTLAGRLNATSWGANRIDIFVRGTDGAEYHKFWDGRAWQPAGTYEGLGGQISSKTDLY